MQHTSKIKNYTRGGQITLHNIRMFLQITNKVALLGSLIFFIVMCTSAWLSISPYERYVTVEYSWSTFIPLLNDQTTTDFMQPDGRQIKTRYSDINQSPLVKAVIRNVSLKLIRAMLIGAMVSLVVVVAITYWLNRRGETQTENKLIKGDVLASKKETRELLIKAKVNSDITLGNLPIIKNSEITHFLFHGTTRSGKSNAIKELLDQIRQRGERAIIYDKSCNLLQEFYQPEKDILLNPLDERGKCWDLWAECRDSADFDSVAAALIPMISTQDPFWVNAARTIFSSAAFQMRHDPERSIYKLLRYLLTADLDIIQKFLQGTEAETLVSEKIEKTAISIKSTLATYIKSLKYVTEDKEAFSIRKWIQNEEDNHWLFITSLGDRHETLKPLISSWLDIAVNALISLPPNENRRIWIILDELYSLQRLPYLETFLSEAGKFGGCAVAGLQNYSQLQEVYGDKGARVISSLLNTRVMFREPDPDVAKWSALNLGESITDEVREGISYGANTMRDGISINRVETRNPLISFSEIMSLANLHAYVRLPGKYPITLVDFNYRQREKRNEGIIARKIDEIKIDEIDEMIRSSEKIALIANQTATFEQSPVFDL